MGREFQRSVENSVGKVENKLKNICRSIHLIHAYIYVKMNIERHKKSPVSNVLDDILNGCAHLRVLFNILFDLLNGINNGGVITSAEF